MTTSHDGYVILTTGDEGADVARILGLDPRRVTKNFEISIGADSFSRVRLELRLTPAELGEIVRLVTDPARRLASEPVAVVDVTELIDLDLQ